MHQPVSTLACSVLKAPTLPSSRSMSTKSKFTTKKLLAEFKNSVDKQDTNQAWYVYHRLQHRFRNTPVDLSSSKVIPRRLAHHPKIALPTMQSDILSVLNLEHVVSYNPYHASRMTERIKKVLKAVADSGGALSSRDLNVLLRYFATIKNGEAADHIWQYAALSGMSRDITNYNSFVNVKLVTGELERAMETIREIRRAGLQPNSYTQACLIRLYGLLGDLEAAKRVFKFACSSTSLAVVAERFMQFVKKHIGYWQDSLEDANLSGPTVHIYNEMLDVLGMNGMVEEMRVMFEEMVVERGIKPTRASFQVMIKWHAKYWDMDSAEKYLEMMPECKIRPTAATFKLLITPETALRDLTRCGKLAMEMSTKYSVPPAKSIINTLEIAAKKVKEMEQMVKEAEAQKTSLFAGLYIGSVAKETSAEEEKGGWNGSPSH